MRCPICPDTMDQTSGYGAVTIDTYECPTCGCQWCFGLHKMPDPDRLRDVGDQLHGIADEIEAGDGLAGRLRRALS